MRTAKKALALVMVFALALSMMAGAAFTDAGSINRLDAVNTLSALGIIAGFPDGSFKPDQVVTRAEMAKMIYVLKNAGRDDGATYFKSSVNAFYDVKGHWAEGYVNYAYALGIIAGKGNGVFDPDASVTGLEAAKMLLVTLGYNATTEGLVGSQWAIKTAALAQSSNLFDNYGVGLGEGSPRQYAAQMIVNALDAAIVEYTDGVAKKQYDSSNKAITLGSRTVSTKTAETVLVANDKFSYDETGAAADGKITLAANTASGSSKVTAGSYTFAGADELVGQKVKVMYKEEDGTDGLTSGDKVIGLAALSANNLVSFTRGDIDNDAVAVSNQIKMKTTGTKYKLAAQVNLVYNNYGAAADGYIAGTLKANSADAVTLIDNDGDGYYDVIKVVLKKFTKVTAVGSTAVSMTGIGTIDFDDNTIYSGIAKNDYVLVTSNYNSATTKEDYIVEKVTPIVAELTGRNSSGDLYVDGAYVSVDKAAYLGGAGSDDFYWGKTTDDIGGNPALGEDITLYKYGKYWVLAKGVEASKLYCVVLAADDTDVVLEAKAKVLHSDGTKATYVVDSVKDSGGTTAAIAADKVYSYSITSSGKIKLTELANTGTNHYDKDTKTTSGAAGTKILDDSTVIFANNTTADSGVSTKWKALVYGDIKSIDITSTAGGAYVIDGSKLKLVTFAKAGGVAAGGSNLTYGFVTATPGYVKSGDDYLVTYTIWDGTTSLSKTMNVGSTAPSFSGKATKGAFVAFKTKADGKIVDADDNSNLLLNLKTSMTDGRIFTVSGSIIGMGLTGSSTSAEVFYQITDDTQIIFVEADDDKAAAYGDVTTFDSTKNAIDTAFNAKFEVETGTNKLEVLFIDIDSTINS